MNFRQQLEAFLNNLMALDGRKKIGLAAGLMVTLVAVIVIGSVFNKPVTAPLYSNLSREDLNSMSRVLSENGIDFVVQTENGSVEVAPSTTARARMLLAEHGLPSSHESGYELFDRVNTLGLTSFMQDVTNKRAIEGELVRTIQMINGVNSARVHLVMAEKNVFKRNLSAKPSASVVLKTYGTLPSRSINAIRHMVAASVPSLESDNVTIVGADGSLMTTKDDAIGGSTRLVELEKEFEQYAENKIVSALGAYLGAENLRVSVTAKLNSDKRRTDETIFDPASRVERSVQVVREQGSTENKETAQPTTVEQNLPDENALPGSGQSSLENSERREELTNYEINEKKTSVVSDGYQVESLSIALVVNKARLLELVGENPAEGAIDTKIAKLTELVRSAVSASEERGDKVTVSMVEFMPVPADETTGSQNAVTEFLAVHFGAILNVVGLIVAALIFALLGIRPLLAFLQRAPAELPAGSALLPQRDQAAQALGDNSASGAGQSALSNESSAGTARSSLDEAEAELAELATREAQVREQLKTMISQNEDRAVSAIKHWLQEDHAPAS